MVNWNLHIGGALEVLPQMPAESVHCCVTSPPYWQLRDYGVDGQLGLEPTVAEYVEALVAIFREVRRVLRDDGTLWLNLGDKYVGARNGTIGSTSMLSSDRNHRATREAHRKGGGATAGNCPDLKYKDLIGLPWRVAFALQADGWYLRSDIIWEKPTAMPESVKDRPTGSHEYVFLLSKSQRYYYDAEAIMEPVTGGAKPRGHGVHPKAREDAQQGRVKANTSFSAAVRGLVERRNKRSVWRVQSVPYRGAHFATFPPALVRPCILAGSPVGGTVLDPFAGSGTTGAVAITEGRCAELVELSPSYGELARERLLAAEYEAGLPQQMNLGEAS